MARPYTKRDEAYWQARKAGTAAPQPITVNNITQPAPVVQGTPFPDIIYGSQEVTARGREAFAGAVSQPPTASRGSQVNSPYGDGAAFQNIRALPSTFVGYTGNRSYTGMQEPIMLCAKAWAGVPVVRNAIEVSVEFSCQPLLITCDNVTVKTFFEEWFKAVQMNKLKKQFFREYYRSGNVFLYRFEGKFGPAYYKNFQRAFAGRDPKWNSFAAKDNRVPIRYELLNPTNVFVPTGLTFPYTYVRMLSTYEVERLKHPVTEQDRQVYKDLPQVAKDQIKVGSVFPMGLWIPMDPDRLRFAFYKKQDYEPLAIPMVWPVLPYIEWDLTLMKMDMELARKIEHAILLVTTGEAPSQWNGGNGINQNNIARLQNLFSNQTLTRYLVADYTTQAKWLVPDVKEILGPEKYAVVTERIKEGLQSILTGHDKFANAQMKAKIFIQRLEEGQDDFLEFLMPEIESICDVMGFRTVPKVGFRKIDLQDEAIMSRIYAQLAQIGVLTAEQAVKAIDTQELPSATEMQTGQQAYKAARDKGLYEPLVGGQKDDGSMGPNGRPAGSGGGKQVGTRKSTPKGTTKAFSMKAYTEHLRASQDLTREVEKALQKRFKVKELTEAQQDIAQVLVKKIVTIEPKDKWSAAIAGTIKTPPQIPAEIARELDEIRAEHDVDDFDAALLRWSHIEAPAETA